MKTRISKENPFRGSFRFDHAFVWEQIRIRARGASTPALVMDYGAHDGKMLRTIINSGLPLEGYGVDANKGAVARGREQVGESIPLQLGSVSDFETFSKTKGGFDIICLMGVLEHVLDQGALLDRLHGAMRPGGTLLLSVPGKHFLSWLDFGNWKFYFPRIHRFFVERTKGSAYYREKFIDCPNGLFGDIEVGKNEHQHFSRAEIVRLLEGKGFGVEIVDGYGHFYRLLHNVWWFTPSLLKPVIEPLIRADLRAGSCAELVLSARRT